MGAMGSLTIIRTLPCHRDNYTPGRARGVEYLVIHYVGASGGAQANARYYHNTPGIGASAHYFVGHAGEGAPIYASVAEGDTAWHCGRADGKYVHPYCRNANSIGVELCCHQDAGGGWYFDRATLERGAALARDIMARYQIPPGRVVRHYDVTGKCCPAPFVLDPAAWAGWRAGLEGEDLTTEETRALFQACYEAQNPLYTALDQVPAYWREETKRLMQAGALEGDGVHELHIRQEALAALVAASRYLDEKKEEG